MSRDYRKIIAFRQADDLAVKVYETTRKVFPKEELYGLTSQMRRAAVSVAANIAEGSARQHLKEFLHFLYTAKSSLAEVEYYAHLSKRLGYLTEEVSAGLGRSVSETGRVLHGLIGSVTKQISEGDVFNRGPSPGRGLLETAVCGLVARRSGLAASSSLALQTSVRLRLTNFFQKFFDF